MTTIETKEFFASVQSALPRLRHHGWLLTGSREAAEDYAQAWLEHMIQEKPTLLIEENNYGRDASFFKSYHDLISRDEIKLDTGRISAPSTQENELLILTVDQRTALLLIHVEGFTQVEAAFITDTSSGEFSRRLSSGRTTLKTRIAAPIFIIEDQLVETLDITRLVEGFGHNVCGTAAHLAEAKSGIATARPQLILSDVQLGNDAYGGIELCEELHREHDLPVIYITGYPERVRDMVRRENVFVVAKPVEPEVLRATMGLALSITAH